MTDSNVDEQASDAPGEGPSDGELLDLVRDGDTASYAALWARHSRAALTVARSVGANGDADDLVAEAYTAVLDAVRRGKGPTGAFRPYLFTTIRNLSMKWSKSSHAVDSGELPDVVDPTTTAEADDAFIEKSITVTAFKNLPERWQTVLWYTEVEGLKPAEAAVMMGMSANSVAALAYRAREGLRKEWLQAHISHPATSDECRWSTARMADHNRGTLSKRDEARFADHVASCMKCSILVEEIDEIGSRLAIMLLPMILGGSAAAAYLESLHGGAADQATSGPEVGTGDTAARVLGAKRQSRRAVASTLVGLALVAAVAVGATAFVTSFPAAQPDPISAPRPDNEEQPVAAPEASPVAGNPDLVPVPEPTPEPPSEADRKLPQAMPVVEPPSHMPADTVPTLDVTAPQAPGIGAPVAGSTVGSSTPVVSGSGEPGATANVYTDATAVTTVVGTDGRWAVTLPLGADGAHTIGVVQTDAAGNASPAASVSIVTDTVALAPVIEGPEIGVSVFFLPDFAGAAEPGANIVVSDEVGQATVAQADSTGAFTVSMASVVPYPGQTFSAVQTDSAGNVSEPSVPTNPFFYLTPGFASLVDGGTVAYSAGQDANGDGVFHHVLIDVTGVVGQSALIFVDGETSGTMHQFDGPTISRISRNDLQAGPHTFGARYSDATGRVGALSEVTVTAG